MKFSHQPIAFLGWIASRAVAYSDQVYTQFLDENYSQIGSESFDVLDKFPFRFINDARYFRFTTYNKTHAEINGPYCLYAFHEVPCSVLHPTCEDNVASMEARNVYGNGGKEDDYALPPTVTTAQMVTFSWSTHTCTSPVTTYSGHAATTTSTTTST